MSHGLSKLHYESLLVGTQQQHSKYGAPVAVMNIRVSCVTVCVGRSCLCTMESEEAKNSKGTVVSPRGFPEVHNYRELCPAFRLLVLEVNVVAAYPHMQQRPRTTNGRETTFKVAPMGPPNS